MFLLKVLTNVFIKNTLGEINLWMYWWNPSLWKVIEEEASLNYPKESNREQFCMCLSLSCLLI
jgi:hypothetical protein